jgi:hypothetical protein
MTDRRGLLWALRKWITIVCGLFATSVFCGLIAATLVKVALKLDNETAALYVGFPVGLVIAIYLWPKMPRMFGFD